MVVFLHIPKAAGTTVKGIINAQINPKNPLGIDDISRIAYASDEWLNSHDFISGHFGVSLLRRLNVGCRVITMLRNPVARTISQYQYIKDLAGHGGDFNGYHNLLNGRNLKELLTDRDSVLINSWFRNTQTWALVSDYQHHYRNYLMPDDEVLAIAKENLEKMSFFGLVEAMEDFFGGLNSVFGWNIDIKEAARVKSNPTQRQDDNDQELTDVILENNQLDLALYNWAEIKFRERISVFTENRATHQPVVAEMADWKSMQFPEHMAEGFSFANGEIGIHLLINRLRHAESVMGQQSRINIQLRHWAEDAEARMAKMRHQAGDVEALTAKERQTSNQQWEELKSRKKLFSRLFSRRSSDD